MNIEHVLAFSNKVQTFLWEAYKKNVYIIRKESIVDIGYIEEVNFRNIVVLTGFKKARKENEVKDIVVKEAKKIGNDFSFRANFDKKKRQIVFNFVNYKDLVIVIKKSKTFLII